MSIFNRLSCRTTKYQLVLFMQGCFEACSSVRQSNPSSVTSYHGPWKFDDERLDKREVIGPSLEKYL